MVSGGVTELWFLICPMIEAIPLLGTFGVKLLFKDCPLSMVTPYSKGGCVPTMELSSSCPSNSDTSCQVVENYGHKLIIIIVLLITVTFIHAYFEKKNFLIMNSFNDIACIINMLSWLMVIPLHESIISTGSQHLFFSLCVCLSFLIPHLPSSVFLN